MIMKNMDYGHVYRILNYVNRKVYIGSSINVYQRWGQHRSGMRTLVPKTQLQADMQLYGLTFFSFSILSPAKTEKQLRALERVWIYIYSATNPALGYNKRIYSHEISVQEYITRSDSAIALQWKMWKAAQQAKRK